MSLPQWLRQRQEPSRWLPIIQQNSLPVSLPLILVTACLSCADPASTSLTPNAWQDRDAPPSLADVPAAAKPTDIDDSSQPGGDYSHLANGLEQATTLPANYQGNKARRGSAATADHFQLPDIPVERQDRALPLVDRAPF